MQIVCPQCATAYAVETEALGTGGRTVRCARCHTVWHAGGDGSDDAAAPAAAEWRTPGSPLPPLQGSTIEEAQAAAALDWVPTPEGGEEAPAAGEGAVPAPVQSDTGSAVAVMEAPPAAAAGPEIEGVAVASGGDARPESRRMRRPARRAPRNRPQPTAAHAAAALLGVLVALIVARGNMVRLLPQTASLYALVGLPVNVRGLVFADVKTALETQNDMPVLVVEGTVRNVTAKAVEVPPLRLAVRDGAAAEIYGWTSMPDRPQLAAGESQAFRARLASPPAEGREVLVRFVNRHDQFAAAY